MAISPLDSDMWTPVPGACGKVWLFGKFRTKARGCQRSATKVSGRALCLLFVGASLLAIIVLVGDFAVRWKLWIASKLAPTGPLPCEDKGS
ncbi:hypothetical protein D9M71_719560 [compost metagenome]